jgi:hypothetical protein
LSTRVTNDLKLNAMRHSTCNGIIILLVVLVFDVLKMSLAWWILVHSIKGEMKQKVEKAENTDEESGVHQRANRTFNGVSDMANACFSWTTPASWEAVIEKRRDTYP